MNGDNDQIRRMRALLEGFKPLLAKIKARRRQTAEQFNVFEALRVDGCEKYHSRFLVYLLAPRERHDQGDIFLNSFLESLGVAFCLASTRDATALTEFDLGSFGRVDIHIRLTNGQMILLENKVGAQEGPDQIGRYQKWLKRRGAPPGLLHQLVFLTPEGRQPVSTRKPEEVICLSYSQLADWISSHQAIGAARLRVILEQYAETCRQIGGST